MINRLDLARFVVSLLPNALEINNSAAATALVVHRSLVAFSTGVLAEYITRHPKIDEGIIAFVLPACISMIEASGFVGAKDVTLAGAILLASLSHRCFLTPAALEAILGSVTGAKSVIGDTRTMQTVVSILSPQAQLSSLPSSVTREIIRMQSVYRSWHLSLLTLTAFFLDRSITDILSTEASKWAGSDKTLVPLVKRLLNKYVSKMSL